eukprot:2010700-Pleurochrysis_carterae.AAC.5
MDACMHQRSRACMLWTKRGRSASVSFQIEGNRHCIGAIAIWCHATAPHRQVVTLFMKFGSASNGRAIEIMSAWPSVKIYTGDGARFQRRGARWRVHARDARKCLLEYGFAVLKCTVLCVLTQAMQTKEPHLTSVLSLAFTLA